MWEKDRARNVAFRVKEDHCECWAISKKYSEMLMSNIKSKDLYLICETIHGQFLSELKGNNLKIIDQKYTQIWRTMSNTVKKGDKSIMAIKLLHQTNCQRFHRCQLSQ